MPMPPAMVRRRSVVQRPSRWKRVLVIAGLLLGAGMFLGGRSGLLEVWERWRELHRAEQRAAELAAETDSLRQVLWLLENDLDYVEKVAREEYGMSRRSERVYRLPPETEAATERE